MLGAHQRPGHRGRGFTLIELLVVLTIIGLLGSVLLGALYNAQETARAARTRSLVNRLHNMLITRYDSYRTRRLPIDPSLPGLNPGTGADLPRSDPYLLLNPTAFSPAGVVPPEKRAGLYANLRALYARRELMRRELPDQYQDLLLPRRSDGERTLEISAGILEPKIDLSNATEPIYLLNEQEVVIDPTYVQVYVSSLQQAYAQRIIQVADPVTLLPRQVPGVPLNTNDRIDARNQSAELLYLILTTGGGEEADSRNQFYENEVGDTDRDGMLEFVDAWGRPVEWFRWAPGYVSAAQPAAWPQKVYDQHEGGTDRDPFTPASGKPTVRHVSENYDVFDTRRLCAFDFFPFCFPFDGSALPYGPPPPPYSAPPSMSDIEGWRQTGPVAPLNMNYPYPPPYSGAGAVSSYLPDEPQWWGWGFRLLPLIVSGGPDRRFGLFKAEYLPGDIDDLLRRKFCDPYSLYPYQVTLSGTPQIFAYYQRGLPIPAEVDPLTNELAGPGEPAYLDNITNHDLLAR